MSTSDLLADFDNADVYRSALAGAADINARNFVVDFGSGVARIACNLSSNDFKNFITKNGVHRKKETPTRWINVWAPNTQSEVVTTIGHRYGFSARLMAILCTTPPSNLGEVPEDDDTEKELHPPSVRDIERGVPHRMDSTLAAAKPKTTNFFNIATNFTSYQSIDIGENFLCLGANWMHPVKHHSGIKAERLWSWLVICNDATVISFHEDPKSSDINSEYLKTVRQHTLSVLGQLSIIGLKAAGSVELISLRQPDAPKTSSELSGVEGASNLFYYLFDDWISTYTLLRVLQDDLDKLRKKIMAGLDENQLDALAEEIIPELYNVGKLLRSNQHLYRGYENLIGRVLEYREGRASSHSYSGERVSVAHTACHRFERLRDNIKFLVLNYLDEAIGEKDGLHNTYFNITTQKDSMATAKLTSNATLLSKLGVLFLPVSLMTSYFSVQIKELDGVYTVKTYWVTFAVVMVLSFFALFMFSRVLVGATTAVIVRVNNTVDRIRGRRPSTSSSHRRESGQYR